MNQDGIQIISDFRNLSKDSFFEKYNCFFLIKKENESSEKASKNLVFATISVNNLEELLSQAKDQGSENKITEIISVKKSSRNPFLKKIIVGRTTTQDIIIDNSNISKYHGHFEYKAEDDLSFTDRGSTNGTLVNNIKLEASIPMNIKDGDAISFSGINYKVYNNRKTYLLIKDTKFDF